MFPYYLFSKLFINFMAVKKLQNILPDIEAVT